MQISSRLVNHVTFVQTAMKWHPLEVVQWLPGGIYQGQAVSQPSCTLWHHKTHKALFYCDTSSCSVGVCMMYIISGKEQPVEYVSRTLNEMDPAERGSEVHAMAIDHLPVTAKLVTKTDSQWYSVSQTCHSCLLWKLAITSTRWSGSLSLLNAWINSIIIRWMQYLGKCVMITKVLRAKLFQELHVGHVWIVNGRISQKSFCWSHVHQDIEATGTQCKACKITTAMSTQAALNQWQYPSTPWERVYIVYGELTRQTS